MFKGILITKALESPNHKCNYKNNNEDLPDNMHIEDNKSSKLPLYAHIKPYNLKHNQTLSWIMYCDFESILVSVKVDKYIDKYEHKVSLYCYNLICRERPAFNKFKLYHGENENDVVSDKLFDHIKDILIFNKRTDEELKQNKLLIL